jgi:hypothetical protein
MHFPSSDDHPGTIAKSCELTYVAPSWARSAGTPACVATDASAACRCALVYGQVPLTQVPATQGSARRNTRVVRRSIMRLVALRVATRFSEAPRLRGAQLAKAEAQCPVASLGSVDSHKSRLDRFWGTSTHCRVQRGLRKGST